MTKIPPSSEIPYYYNDKELEDTFNNYYTKAQKLEITMQLESDYKSGMLSVEQLTWIINQKKCGSFTAKLILDDMFKKKIIRKNPLTGENRPFIKPKGVFDF